MPTIEEIKTALGKIDESLEESTGKSPRSAKLFAPIEQLESELRDKDKIIESLKNESIVLKNQISTIEEEKSTILEELAQSKWLESKAVVATKKVYEDKVKTIIRENVDSKIIPVLTAVARKKQGNQQLTWDNWLKIPENRYLFHVSDSIAKGIFEETNNLIERRFESEDVRGGGVVKTVENYFLSFTGNDEHDQRTPLLDTARVDLVATQFTPNDPTNKGFDEGSGRKPLAESGFTVAYWWNPYEKRSDSFAVGWKRATNARFEFGISTHTKPYFAFGSNQLNGVKWETMFDTSGNSDLKNTLLDNGVGTDPGSGDKLILNKWYHMVFTYAGTDNVDGDGNMLRKIYVNGTHIYGGFGEAKQSHNWTDNLGSKMTKGLAFGMRAVVANGNHTDGLRNTKYNNGNACGLDEVAIYSEEKDATWVEAVYNGQTDYNHIESGGNGLVGYWRFEEGSGDIVKDLPGYGWHGTLTNAGYGTKIDGTVDNSSTIAGINARFPNAKPSWEEEFTRTRG